MARGSAALLLPNRRQHLARYPYHKLDQIQEDDHDSEQLGFFESYQEEEQQISGNSNSFSVNPAAAAAARVQALRSKMYSLSMRRSSIRSGYSSSQSCRRRNKWRRVRLRICRVRFISWLSPMEFLKNLRKAYIQAISSKESQCGLVMMGSPWSFPVVVPFRGC